MTRDRRTAAQRRAATGLVAQTIRLPAETWRKLDLLVSVEGFENRSSAVLYLLGLHDDRLEPDDVRPHSAHKLTKLPKILAKQK